MNVTALEKTGACDYMLAAACKCEHAVANRQPPHGQRGKNLGVVGASRRRSAISIFCGQARRDEAFSFAVPGVHGCAQPCWYSA